MCSVADAAAAATLAHAADADAAATPADVANAEATPADVADASPSFFGRVGILVAYFLIF